MPRRYQRSRRPGARLPAGVVYVGRPTKFGNPYLPPAARVTREMRAQLVHWFRIDLEAGALALTDDDLAELRGKDLACWCPLDQPCHADVLLAAANSEHVVDGAELGVESEAGS